MKKLLFIFAFIVFAQNFSEAQELRITDSQGNFLASSGSINSISEEFFNNEQIHAFHPTDDYVFVVGFKQFTNEVLFLVIRENPSSEQINEAINKFSLSKYFKSNDFKRELTKRIKDKNLTDLQALQIFGQPDNKIETKDTSMYQYSYPNVTLYFSNGLLENFIFK